MLLMVVGIGTGVALTTTPQPAAVPSPWLTRIQAMDQALGYGEISAAIYFWRDAYGEAMGSRRWDALADVGDAALRIDTKLGDGRSFRPEARRVYLEALFRARSAGADDGIRRVADAFAQLGDSDMSSRALQMVQNPNIRKVER
jgi:hypothetical protein